MKIKKSQSKQKAEQRAEKPRVSDLNAALKMRAEADLPAAPVEGIRRVTQPRRKDEAKADAPRKAQEQQASAEFRDRTERQSSQSSRGRQAPEEHTPTTGRFFYALKVPASVTGPLSEAQRKLKGNWRTTGREQMHVTLCYLPSAPLDRLAELKALGARLTENLGPMDVKLRGTGYFPNEGSPRVWFVKVEAEGLDELAASLRAGVHELGIETEELGFKAHITLARRKGPAPRVPPMNFELGWKAGGATLQRSHLQKTGPVHEQVSTFRFQTVGQPTAPPDASSLTPTTTDHSSSPTQQTETQEPS
ncbi:RNA 2',3'-cyclic phosphodiesterase [Deinococcus arenicola]|uniref:RNA 2',3'-cyclic phosphodiesterase n=1 Tax=Deinococcus arenicola TaxID=2994950 RepID=A0ABU4DU05_9DEIO|nr:RNA 2',3'-cyclic phosphodiesterase [Deinococcus sp. ZS9-10]MDV6375903.1 RNA 2',3'-cyclic phosphodiesterase [Deinococcus sp. ZS9-10]